MFRRSVFLVVCLAAVVLLVSATESNASPARVAGLNLMGPWTGFVRDYVNTYDYPVAINRYPNMMWAHLGESRGGFEAGHRVMGMYHELGEDGQYGILGVTLREDSPMDPLLMYLDYYGASHQQFDLMYGRDMEQVSFGLRFDMARSSYEDGDGNTTAPDEFPMIGIGGYVNTWGIGAGVDVDINEDAMLEVGAEFRKYTFKDEASEIEDDGSVSFRANARVFWERAENKTLIPLVGFNRTQIGEQDGLKDTWTDFVAGAACNHMVNGDDLLIYGAAFRAQSFKTENEVVENDDSGYGVPILFMALEHKFRDWLVGRGGASQAMVTQKDKTDEAGDEKWTYSDFNFALGIGMEFSNFTIDATLNQNYPFTGFWFVSGEETNDLFGMVSFTYTY